MDVSRRRMMTGLGGLGLAAALSSGLATWAEAAPPLEDAELESLRRRWVDLITGRDLVDPTAEVFAAPLAVMDERTNEALEQLDTTEDRTRIFVDQSFDSDSEMNGTMIRLADLATAWATPGSAHHESPEVLEIALAGLRDTNRLCYRDGGPYFGNWWFWEIGASRAMADATSILRDHIDPVDLAAYCAAIDYYVPDPHFHRGRDASAGANRVDLCQAVAIRAIAGGDAALLQHALAGLSDTWQVVTREDGFYADGSFIQHKTVPYTGTYGSVLLGGLSTLFALVAGSGHDIDDPSRVVIDEAIDSSFAPVIYRGQMMDSIRGRAISREAAPSYHDGDGCLESILRLAQGAEEGKAARWRGLCRQWIEAGRTGTAQHDILDGASVARTALVHAVMSSDVEPVPDTAGPTAFAAMDRLVHRGAENQWALAVAMCSRRITWYECGNGENDLGAQTSSGMTYLYLENQDSHYDDQFWPTSDLTAPCGTTVDTTPLPPRVEGQWGIGLPQNEWTGASALDEWSLAGQDLIGPGGTGLHARKTWFAGKDFVACLGSDITTGEQVAETSRTTSAADAHVNDGPRATTSYGSNHTLLVKTIASPDSGYTRQTFLRFTPGAVTDPFDQVVLGLYARVNDSAGTSEVIDVHLCGDFDEATLTWDEKPDIGDHIGQVDIGSGYAWCTADLTEALQDAVVAGRPVTLALTQDLSDGDTGGLSVEIRSRESGTGPYLATVNADATTHGRVKTVVEHRNTGESAGRLVVDGSQVTDETMIENASWAHLADTAGYVFLAPGSVRASTLPRTGSWSRVHTAGSDTEHTRHYATLEIPHDGQGAGTYAYLVLPGADESTTRDHAADPSVTVLENTARVQACLVGPVTAANFWRAGSVAGITVDGPASVLARRAPGSAALAVGDPTQKASTVVVDLEDAPYQRAEGEGVTMTRQGTGLRLSVDVADRGGAAVSIRLHRR